MRAAPSSGHAHAGVPRCDPAPEQARRSAARHSLPGMLAIARGRRGKTVRRAGQRLDLHALFHRDRLRRARPALAGRAVRLAAPVARASARAARASLAARHAGRGPMARAASPASPAAALLASPATTHRRHRMCGNAAHCSRLTAFPQDGQCCRRSRPFASPGCGNPSPSVLNRCGQRSQTAPSSWSGQASELAGGAVRTAMLFCLYHEPTRQTPDDERQFARPRPR